MSSTPRLGWAAFVAAACLFAANVLARPEGTRPNNVPLGLYEVDRPAGDELTPAKTALGERFFEDPRLSRGGRISCATCHAPASGFAERSAIAKPAGVTRTHRNSQSILNAGYRATLGWDGRFPSLEDQVKGSFSPWGDMGMDLPDAVTAVATDSSYVNGCRRAFNLSLNPECLARAIAAYERSLVRGDSPFDRYLFGGDLRALDARARAGWELFKGRAGCIACHDVFHSSTNDLGSSYALLSDERFHNLGVGYADGRMQDVGRYGVTKAFADFGAFKTPMLRNVADTPPYMHDGSLPMLYDVVTFYNRGGNPNPNLSPGLKPLHLSENEKLDLVAFLRSLSSPRNSPNISR